TVRSDGRNRPPAVLCDLEGLAQAALARDVRHAAVPVHRAGLLCVEPYQGEGWRLGNHRYRHRCLRHHLHLAPRQPVPVREDPQERSAAHRADDEPRQEEMYLVDGPAVFLTGDPESAPTALLHSLKHYKVLHKSNIILSLVT